MSLVTMREILDDCKIKGIACGAFNMANMEMTMGAIRAAEEMKSPIILQLAEGRLAHSPLRLMGPMLLQAARDAKVPVAVHLDHGKTLANIRTALELGFTSIMFDGSNLPAEENIRMSVIIKDLVTSCGASFEAEIGVVGGSEGEGAETKAQYTNPEDAETFYHKVKPDALAIAVGNAHGQYRAAPELRFDIIEEVRDRVGAALVLHGGSGISDDDFQMAIRKGIRKINIATAGFTAMTDGAAEYLMSAGAERSYFGLNEAMTDAAYRTVRHHIDVFRNI